MPGPRLQPLRTAASWLSRCRPLGPGKPRGSPRNDGGLLIQRVAPLAPRSKPDTAHHRNNFDALRLIAALSVVFSHSFLIAEGSEANEPFVWLSGNQCILGLVGVFVFFVISGYLVTESWCRSPMPGHFALRRGLRIYPGLAVNVALCALLIGPLVTSLPLSAYFAGPELGDFLVKTLTLKPGPLALPGVLFADTSVGLH